MSCPQVWWWVRGTEEIPKDVKKDAGFWRMANSFRYWDESGRYLAKEEILKSYDLSGLGIAEFKELFDRFWAENPEFYRTPIKEISDRFLEFVRVRVGATHYLKQVPALMYLTHGCIFN